MYIYTYYKKYISIYHHIYIYANPPKKKNYSLHIGEFYKTLSELIPNCDTQGSIWTFPTFGCQTWERSWTSIWLERMQRLGPVAVVVAGEVWSLWTALFGHSLHLVMRFGTGPSRAFGWKRLQRSSPVVVPGMWRYEHLSMYCKARWCIAKPEAAGTFFFSGGRRKTW